ncbi:MAG: hypothetical protein EON91_05645 [Brevundimonas sp.]|uniref:hypothetical protein n=1 Tax=Brevundimonas sp. TaxID=1871086 RepID=UPI0012006A87|nr:hypothetical protein [Brevundimonas sp.]RZJ18367.1 MAG: hypothetical protein EON91_05645 [Brevundimonas sp.]
MRRAIGLVAALLLLVAAPAAAQDHDASPEVFALFQADQAARGAADVTNDALREAADTARRQQLRALVDRGALKTADDYLFASVVFQHGFGDDILLAHALATVALARGKVEAAVMVASSLDRYLMDQGRPQIYGTQFMIPFNGEPVTQAPYVPDLLTDDMRRAVGVPSLAEQDDQRRAYEAGRQTPQ